MSAQKVRLSRILRGLLDDHFHIWAVAHLDFRERDATPMSEYFDPHFLFPILVIIAFMFWAILATIVDKVLDIIERKRNKCN